jgi:enoyl-CoA hydratase
VRAVVPPGAAPFSPPRHIGRSPNFDGPRRRDSSPTCLRTFAAIEECRLPVIAAVNGLALGGGCELALACDMVLAAEHAAFGLPEASVGLVPGFGILRAPSVLGRHTAKLMVLAGERISAQRAYELGLVQQVLPAAESCLGRCGSGAKIAERRRWRWRSAQGWSTGAWTATAVYGVEAVTMLYSTRDAARGSGLHRAA